MGALANWFSGLSPRERRLAGIFGTVVALLLLFLVPFGIDAMLRSRREANTELRDAIHRVQASRGIVGARKAKREALVQRYAKKAPKLGGFLEAAAREEKLELPEVQDKPELPIGKRYVERGTMLRMRKVGGYPLLKFLERIEQSGHPVAVTRLNLRKRGGDRDSYDVELVVSAYDRNDPNAPAAAPTGTGAGEPEK
jgi:general secretion pathway protein M